MIALDLTSAKREELEHLRDQAALPYLRERAAALLKIADGQSATRVARHGLLRRRNYHTVLAWLHRYQADGLAGLMIRAGRGRKPAFSPSLRDAHGGPDRPAASPAA